MNKQGRKPNWAIRIIERAEEMAAVEELQRVVWPGNETEIVPLHMLVTMAQNGGLVIGAYLSETPDVYQGAFSQDESGEEEEEIDRPENLPRQLDTPGHPPGELVGFAFGFPGLYPTPDGPRLKHCSHMLAVRPDFRDQGLGFALKRAQWQMVRHQGVDLITWTYDPIQSRNAMLNIARLGAVCNTYKRNEYGEMRDELNAGVPSDRFQVDWWLNTQRVKRRLSRRRRLDLDLAHFLAADAQIINPSQEGVFTWARPAQGILPDVIVKPHPDAPAEEASQAEEADNILLLEIPADFQALKEADQALAIDWRMHTRQLFEDLFRRGYLVTDFVYLPGTHPRSFYVLTHGETTLLGVTH